jgi:hypothetical protein
MNIYQRDNLTPSFAKRFSELFSYKRGGGYYCWKADILLQQLDKSNEGDIIVYCDAGCTVEKSGRDLFFSYIDLLRNSCHDTLSFEHDNSHHDLSEKRWTTRQLFKYFGVEN